MRTLSIKKGDLYFADLSPVTGSEQGGVRPVLVVQNDVGNKYSPTIIVAAITSKKNKADLPTHVAIDADGNGLSKNSLKRSTMPDPGIRAALFRLQISLQLFTSMK